MIMIYIIRGDSPPNIKLYIFLGQGLHPHWKTVGQEDRETGTGRHHVEARTLIHERGADAISSCHGFGDPVETVPWFFEHLTGYFYHSRYISVSCIQHFIYSLG